MSRAIDRRLRALEQRQDGVGRMVHYIEALDHADSARQIAELDAAGKVGPRDGFLCLLGSRYSEWAQGPLPGLAAGLEGNP